jgi:hypothetical protein
VLLAATTWRFAAPLSGGVSSLEGVRLLSTSLEALDRGGDVLWRYEFASPVRAASDPVHPWRRHERTRVVDIDGDGRREVIAAVSYRDDPVRRSDEIYCFGEDGELRWMYSPKFSLRFREQRYDSPWALTDVVVVPARGEVWVAVVHNVWWPSAVVRIDASGEAEIRFVQAGHVYTLAAWESASGRHLVAAGINNEYASASLALIDPAGPAVSSPQTAGSEYECVECPRESPARYALLPRSEVNRLAKLTYNRAVGAAVLEERLSVGTDEAWEVPGAGFAYLFGPGLKLESAKPSDGYWTAHQLYEDRGLIPHPVDRCSERTTPPHVRVFAPGKGWSPVGAQTK